MVERAFIHVTPELLSVLPDLLPAKIVGTRDCDGVCILVIEGAGLKPGARYVLYISQEPMRKVAELRETP